MQKFKIIVAYDGTDFYGWQVQPVDISVASCLQNAFFKAFGHAITVVGASRTDAGVHALGQVAHFFSDLNISDEALLRAWGNKLPKSIVIRSLVRVPHEFHSHRNVVQKTYLYHLFLKRPMPFIARYGWHYRFVDQVDLEKFYKGLQIYQGEHDFASFCTVEDGKDTVRKIDAITVKKLSHWNVLQIQIQGKSFLRFQIRRMIGYALDVARRDELPVDYLKEVLESKNPEQTLLKAEGSGLCLRRIIYHE